MKTNLVDLVKQENVLTENIDITQKAKVSQKRRGKWGFNIGGKRVYFDGSRNDAIKSALNEAKEIEKRTGTPVYSIKLLT